MMTMSHDMSRSHFTNALDLMIMSVYKPDPELRMEAKSLGCLDELMDIRERVLDYLHEIRKES